jgi:hypothetical protein
MSTDLMSFPLSEPAKKKSRMTANACSIVFAAIISCGAVAVLYKLKSKTEGMDTSGQMLVLSLIALTVILWGAWLGAIIMATVRHQKWFAATSGTLSFAADSLHIGALNIERSSIVSSEKTRRHLLIRYRSDGKPCRVALPLTWLPVGAADDILQRIENKDG